MITTTLLLLAPPVLLAPPTSLASPIPLASLGGVTVTLPMEARVRGTEITLGELATVTGDDASAVARVAAVELGYAPMPGHSRLFQALRLEQIVERDLGLDVRFAGDATCRAWPVAVELDPRELEGVAAAELSRLAGRLDVELAMRDLPRSVQIPVGALGMRLESHLADDDLRSGTLSVPVQVFVDGELYRTIWTAWDVSIYETRTVLARDVRAGEALGPDLFREKRVRVPRPGAGNPVGRQMVVGAVAARNLRADELVTQFDVNRPIAVRRGESVYLQARKGGVIARVPAVAKENGAIGDRILVATLANGHELSALVLSMDMVEVDLGQ